MKSYFQIVSNELVVKGTKKYEVARIIWGWGRGEGTTENFIDISL